MTRRSVHRAPPAVGNFADWLSLNADPAIATAGILKKPVAPDISAMSDSTSRCSSSSSEQASRTNAARSLPSRVSAA